MIDFFGSTFTRLYEIFLIIWEDNPLSSVIFLPQMMLKEHL